jgi:hypothetical protein
MIMTYEIYGAERRKENGHQIRKWSAVLSLIAVFGIALMVALYFLTDRGNYIWMIVVEVLLTAATCFALLYLGLAYLKPECEIRALIRRLSAKTVRRAHPREGHYLDGKIVKRGLRFSVLSLEENKVKITALLEEGEEQKMERDEPDAIYLVDRFVVGWSKKG